MRKWQKTISGGQVFFEGKVVFDDENEYYFFMGKLVLNIFYLTIFLKNKQHFWRKWKKNFEGHDHLLEEGVILL